MGQSPKHNCNTTTTVIATTTATAWELSPAGLYREWYVHTIHRQSIDTTKGLLLLQHLYNKDHCYYFTKQKTIVTIYRTKIIVTIYNHNGSLCAPMPTKPTVHLHTQ